MAQQRKQGVGAESKHMGMSLNGGQLSFIFRPELLREQSQTVHKIAGEGGLYT